MMAKFVQSVLDDMNVEKVSWVDLTPLHLAAEKNSADVAELLIRRGMYL